MDKNEIVRFIKTRKADLAVATVVSAFGIWAVHGMWTTILKQFKMEHCFNSMPSYHVADLGKFGEDLMRVKDIGPNNVTSMIINVDFSKK